MMDEIDDKADKVDAGRKAGLVSIVVPVYNAERFIEETIFRVQAQTYDSWESRWWMTARRIEAGS